MRTRSALVSLLAASILIAGPPVGNASGGAPLRPMNADVSSVSQALRESPAEVDFSLFRDATPEVLVSVRAMMVEPPLPIKEGQPVPEMFPQSLAAVVEAGVRQGYPELVNFTQQHLTDAGYRVGRAAQDGWSMEVRQQSDTHVTAGARQRFQDSSGAYVDVDVSMETPLQTGSANPVTDSSRDGAVQIKMESSTSPGVRRSTTVRMDMGNRDVGDYCPDHTGKFSWKDDRKQTTKESVKFGPAFLELASTDNDQSRTVTVKVEGSLGPDARLKPLKVSVTSQHQMRGTFAGAGFTLVEATLSGTATASGTLNPKTGTLSGKGTQISLSGTPFFEDLYGDELRRDLESDVDSVLKSVLETARVIEDKARGGSCTTARSIPWSGAQLNRREKLDLDLNLTAEHDGKEVTTTRWRVIAVKGSVDPGYSKQAKPTFTVTGQKPDKEGGDSAYLKIEVVSPAGISKIIWRATEDFKFPAAYSGPVAYNRTMDLSGLVEHIEWDGNATYSLKTQKTRKDGSRYATYRLTGMTINDYLMEWTSDSLNCKYSETLPAARVVGGSLEIDVTKSGEWSATFSVDVTLGQKPRGCDYGYPVANDSAEMKAVMNASGPGNKRRPMPEPASAIAAAAVSDLFEFTALPNTQGTASWDLRPRR